MFVQIDHVDKVFPLANGGKYVALKNIELEIKEGEFISLIGHSGCGKSTLLNMIAGLDRATSGGVILEGLLLIASFRLYSLIFLIKKVKKLYLNIKINWN